MGKQDKITNECIRIDYLHKWLLKDAAIRKDLKDSAIPGLLVVRSEALQKPVGPSNVVSNGNSHSCPLIVSTVNMHPHDELAKAPARRRSEAGSKVSLVQVKSIKCQNWTK